MLTSAPTSKGVSGAPIVDMYGRVVAIYLGSMEPISPTIITRIQDEVRVNPDIQKIKRKVEELRAQERNEAPPAETGALTIGSSDIVASILDESFVGQKSTVFGGGLIASFLHTFLQRAVEGTGEVYHTVYAQKSVAGFGYAANTHVHRAELAITHHKYNHNKGYLVVSLDDEKSPQGLRVHDCITHVNDTSVGVYADDVSIADLTWFLQSGSRIRLRVDRQGVILHEQHTVGDLPGTIDVCSNLPHLSWTRFHIGDPLSWFLFAPVLLSIAGHEIAKAVSP
jgi:hypothetical protein